MEEHKKEPEVTDFQGTLAIILEENNYLDVFRSKLASYKNSFLSNINIEVTFSLQERNTQLPKKFISDIIEELKIKVQTLNLSIKKLENNQKLSDIILIIVNFIYNQFFRGNVISQVIVNSNFFLKKNHFFSKKDEESSLNYIYSLYNRKLVNNFEIEDIIYLTSLKEFNFVLDFTETNLFNQNKDEFSAFNNSIKKYFEFVRDSDTALIKANRLFFVYYIGLFFLVERFLNEKKIFEKSNNNLLYYSQNLQNIYQLTPFAIFIIDAFWTKDLESFKYFASFFQYLFYYFKEVFVVIEMSSDQKDLLNVIFKEHIIEMFLNKLLKSVFLRKIRLIIFQSNKILYDYNLICSGTIFCLLLGNYSKNSSLKSLKKNQKIHKIIQKMLI
jgi:hypothetical protein